MKTALTALTALLLLCLLGIHQTSQETQIRKALQKGLSYTPPSSTIDFPMQHTPVTYGFSGGRLGDNLLSYLHARWIAHRDDVPLIYRPFPGSDAFALSQDPPLSLPALEIPYFPEQSQKNCHPLFTVPWDDPAFLAEVRAILQPTTAHTLLSLPSDKITLCVHVRRGGTFDAPSVRLEQPLKFPPDSFYIEQIARVAAIFRGLPLYVFLMTDDLKPTELLTRYQKAIPLEGIEWHCRTQPPENDLDDFFSIPLFDCLILCDSNFSLVASKLGEYALTLAPTRYIKKKESVRITDTAITYKSTPRILALMN